MKRIIALLMALLLLLCSVSFSLAESEEDELTDEEREALNGMGEGEDEDEADARSVNSRLYNTDGPKYEEKTVADFSMSSTALYRGDLYAGKSIYKGKEVKDANISPSEQKPASDILFTAKSNTTVDILYVGLQWMIVRYDKYIGYVKRSYIAKSTVVALDPVNTAPFNVQKHAWIATTVGDCNVRSTMDKDNPENIIYTLDPGTEISVWQFQDGWAIVNLWKTYAYIDAADLTDLIAVSPTEEPVSDDSPIAAYTSYYKVPAMMHDPEDIQKYTNRCLNIRLGASYVSVTLKPGEKFNANELMGPYNARKGYEKAGVLTDGGTAQGYGGGTCQVASTLYNAVIQLPGLTITYRRPHGGDGACSYLPCHCDAAVGSSSLNFCFTNSYDFTIRIEGVTNDSGSLLMKIYRVD